MRDRGKLIRVLLLVAGVATAVAVIARTRATSAATAAELPADVRSAIDEGVAAGHPGTPGTSAEPEWIPVGVVHATQAESDEQPAPGAGVAASA